MNLVPIRADAIRLGAPLMYSLRAEDGTLLASKGFVIETDDELRQLIGSREKLFMDTSESDSQHRAFVNKLYDLVRDDKPLGQIANTQLAPTDFGALRGMDTPEEPDWLDLQVQTNAMLRDTNPASFTARLERLQTLLARHTRNNPDGTLFALIHLSAAEVRLYSATHAMLVCVMGSLAAREVLKWPAQLETTLSCAALTMNIGMTELQDRLSMQREPPNPQQRQQIDRHAGRSVEMLLQLGVRDKPWLEAVAHHHTRQSGPLDARSEGQRAARLIQRADMFGARLAPRASRVPDSPAAAMKACYFDEARQIDEAGAALIKAVGIYSPGSFVRLATQEIAVVIRRGANTTMPKVVIMINRSGMPTGDLIVRDTSQRDYRIVASVPHREVKVKINLQRLLPLTKAQPSDRPW